MPKILYILIYAVMFRFVLLYPLAPHFSVDNYFRYAIN